MSILKKEVLDALNDSNVVGYKSYIISIRQTGIGVPLTLIVQNNTTGVVPSSTTSGTGAYNISSPNLFPVNDKVWMAWGGGTNGPIISLTTGSGAVIGYLQMSRASADDIEITCWNLVGTSTDLFTLIGAVRKVMLPQIRIYN